MRLLNILKMKRCYLRALWNSDKIIDLPDGEPIYVGRNEKCGIQDRSVSRKHLKLVANYEKEIVMVEAKGLNYSGCNGYALMKDTTYPLKNGDRIEVRLGHHEFDLIFDNLKEEFEEPKAKKPKLELTTNGGWEFINNELLVYTPENCQSQSKIAAFDIDGTIIKTKSEARFPKDFDDWDLNFGNVSTKLKTLYENEHKIVFFSNQAGLEKDKSQITGFKGKIEKIVRRLGVPVQIFLATSKRSMFRKPAPGMWNYLSDFKNDKVAIDVDQSFFVGDAAGRQDKWAHKKKKDHSISDRLFALNLGLTFYTPEEYFVLGRTGVHEFKMPEFDPRKLQIATYPDIETEELEIVVMVGSPGSGKSHFTMTQLISKGYVHVSRDKLGSWQKCVTNAEDALNKKKNVVIDNTNPDKESRQRYVEVAKKCQVQCRCFVMDVPFEQAKHNNKFRELTDKSHQPITDIILNSYKKKYKEPTLSEGFDEIIRIPFVPKFTNSEHEKLYRMFLND